MGGSFLVVDGVSFLQVFDRGQHLLEHLHAMEQLHVCPKLLERVWHGPWVHEGKKKKEDENITYLRINEQGMVRSSSCRLLSTIVSHKSWCGILCSR